MVMRDAGEMNPGQHDPENVPTLMQDGELFVIARHASHEHHVDVSRRKNVPVNPRDVNWISHNLPTRMTNGVLEVIE
ncbi:hypothetical protein MNV49_005736 [Pseudohyphozyma bogoriensis]|nr:hypothetical protein MNV49_005736 [Pseudohyphozyma bogoriensis]